MYSYIVLCCMTVVPIDEWVNISKNYADVLCVCVYVYVSASFEGVSE